jgi:hypothetical protein
VLTIQPAKNLQGKLDLPPSPGLFILATVVAIARRQPIRFTPPVPVDLPFLREWSTILAGHATMEWSNNDCLVTPVVNDPSLRIDLFVNDLIVFTLLGMGKTIVFKSITEKRCSFWQQQLKRLGYDLQIGPHEATTCMNIAGKVTATAADPVVDAIDLQPLLGLLLGTSDRRIFTVNTALASPLRTIAQAFGFSIEVKSTITKERDALARRVQLMQQKLRHVPSGQQFIVTADFSRNDASRPESLDVTLPGDECAGAVFTAATCIFPKSTLVISNLLLETWATPVVAFIRKMGCKVSVQETGRTTFGSIGMLHVQSTGLTGRKMECVPAVAYIPFLPAMVVIAAFAEGESVFRDLDDLRYDEPDGIEQIESCIRSLGAHHGEMPDGIVLKGGRDFDGFDINSSLPASCAAAFAIAGLRCIGTTTINDGYLQQRLPQLETLLKTIGEYRA